MAKIKIGTVTIDNASITNSGDLLGIRYETEMTIEELAKMYDASTAPQVSVLNDDGTTSALYTNHDLTSLAINMIGGKRVVSVTLKVSSTELSEADKLNEKIEVQATEISTLKTSLSEAETKLADTEARLTDTETKLAEAETKLTEAENRVTELETALAAIEEGAANA